MLILKHFRMLWTEQILFLSILTRVVLSEGRTVTALAASVTAEAAALTPDIQTGDDLGDDHQIGVIND